MQKDVMLRKEEIRLREKEIENKAEELELQRFKAEAEVEERKKFMELMVKLATPRPPQ